MQRGIIAAPGIISRVPSGFIMHRSLSPEELRYYILYWDKVIIPGNNLVYIAVPEEEKLISCNVISRPQIPFRGSFIGDQVAEAILSCQSIVAKQVESDLSTDWSIHQIGDALSIPKNESVKKNIIRVSLNRVLPVPSGDIDIEAILEFKATRQAELIELHDTIDSLYLEIMQSPDQDLASRKVVARFENSIKNLNLVAIEKFKMKINPYSFTTELNLDGKNLVAGISMGTVFDFYHHGISIPIGTILGAIASVIKISAKSDYTFEAAQHKTKLGYLAQAMSENIIQTRDLK